MVIRRRSLLLVGVAVHAAAASARAECVTDSPAVDACRGGVRVTTPPGVTLDLSFFGPTLNPSLTFTRASTATYFDSSGVMQTAAMNQAFPSVLATPAWTVNGPVTLGGSVTLPNGATSTTALIAATDTTNSIRAFNGAFAFTSATVPCVLSAYLKAGLSNGYFQVNSGGAAATAYFDLTNGTAVVGADLAGGLTNKSVSIVSVGNGWYRCSYAFTTTAVSTGANPYIGPCTVVSASGDNRSAVGVVGQGVYAWGVQLEYGSVATPLITTTTAANGAPRFDYDPVTHAALGLLIEEQRINNLLGSGDLTQVAWWNVAGTTTAVGADTSPDGVTKMTRLIETATSANHYVTQGGAVTASTAYAMSVYAKAGQTRYLQLYFTDGANGGFATFDLQAGVISGALAALGTGVLGPAAIQAVGGGIYRCSMAVTTGAGTTKTLALALSNVASPGALPSYTGSTANGLSVWGAQLEAGAFPTSYIGTTAAAVVRSSDLPSFQVGSWYVPPGGSWMAEFVRFNTAASNYCIVQTTASSGFYPIAVSQTGGIVQYDGVFQGGSGTSPANVIEKGAATWAPGSAKVCNNGGVVDSAGTLATGYATAGPFVLFQSTSGAGPLSGYIRRLRYWPRVLSNAEMQSVTR